MQNYIFGVNSKTFVILVMFFAAFKDYFQLIQKWAMTEYYRVHFEKIVFNKTNNILYVNNNKWTNVNIIIVLHFYMILLRVIIINNP